MAARMTGALLAAGIAATLLVGQLLTGMWPDPRTPLSMILPTGIVLGGLLGFRHAPAVVGADHLRMRVVVAFALQALLIGSLAVGVIAVLADHATGLVAPASPVEITIQSLGLAAFGILFLGGAIGPLLVLLATVWAWLLRRLWERRTALDGP